MAVQRTSGKYNTVFFQDKTNKQPVEDEIISVANLRSHKTVLSHGDEEDLFKKVLKFLQEFFTNKDFHRKMQLGLRSAKSSKEVAKCSQQNLNVMSFKKMTTGSRICFEGEVSRKKSPPIQESKAVRCNNKKISIFVCEEDFS